MHVLHLHRFQRHHRLADRDALARLDQNRDNAPVQSGANLAVTSAGCRRLGRCKREVANRMRNASMLEIKVIAPAEEFYALHDAISAEADILVANLLDLKSVLRAVDHDDISALALSDEVELMGAAVNIQACRDCKGRRKRSPAAPRRR